MEKAMDAVVAEAVRAATAAGGLALSEYDEDARPVEKSAMYEIGEKLEAASVRVLRDRLDGRFDGVGWFDEDEHGRVVPEGDWWVVDGLEGAVNHVHGLPEWGVTVALVSDGIPVAGVVRQPIGDLTYVAVRGGGATLNGRPLRVSAKTDLAAAIISASQAGNGPEVSARFGAAFATLAEHALLVRNTVPTTFPLLGVAAGHFDAFWQYEPDLPGSAVGTLIADEAGAIVTDLVGRPWRVDSDAVVVAAPGIHSSVLEQLQSVGVR